MTELSIDDILGQIKLPEAEVPLCLRADLRVQWEHAERAYLEAKEQAGSSLAGPGKAVIAAAQRVRDLEAEMETHTITVKLRAVSRGRWSDLRKDYPPKEGSYEEFNLETFRPALLVECCLSPRMNVEQAQRFIEAMTDGQWDDIERTLTMINKGSVSVPKSRSASETLRGSTKK